MKNFLCKQLKHTKFITALSLFLLHSAGYSAVETYGFINAGTINGISFPAVGTPAQLITPSANPDEFCSLQGTGWRTPLIEEMNLSFKGIKPLTFDVLPPNGSYSLRRVGSLVSEWGGQPSLYSNSGWVSGTYWVAEPSSTGRFRFDIRTPISGSLTRSDYVDRNYVVCAIKL